MNKCFNSRKEATKTDATELCMMLLEVCESSDPIIDELVKGFANRQPKIALASVLAVRTMVTAFGVPTVGIKAVLKALYVLVRVRVLMCRGGVFTLPSQNRIAANKASWISAVVTTDSERRGTRLKVYTSDQGFLLYPQTAFWVSEKVGSTGSTPVSNSTILAMPNGGNNVTITLENMVDPQYGTGKTTIHSFETDGVFVAVPAANLFGGPQQNRRIEFIGDSITAATNVVRPEGAPTCGDGGYQSDWSQSYEALLCHRFGASCSTVAVGGKCVMKECRGLQMPDYFQSAFYHDAPSATYNFKSGWQPDAMVIDLGTNDNNVISKFPDGVQRFVNQTVSLFSSRRPRCHIPGMCTC